MTELFGKLGLWICAAFTGVLAWLWRMNETRLRTYEARLIHLEINAIRKDDLDKLRGEFAQRHEENSEKLNSIDSGVTSTHRRIDDLYRDLMNRD